MSAQIAISTSNYVIPQWTFADRLRKARAQTGLGQKEFAERIGVKSSAYAQWEADNNHPRDIVTVAKSIELLTRVPATWLLGIGGAPQTPEAPASAVKSLHLDNPIVSLADVRQRRLKQTAVTA